jgi:hypothetical protein
MVSLGAISLSLDVNSEVFDTFRFY